MSEKMCEGLAVLFVTGALVVLVRYSIVFDWQTIRIFASIGLYNCAFIAMTFLRLHLQSL